MNILVHYFDENEIEDCGKVNCNIVVSKPELSDEVGLSCPKMTGFDR